MTGALHLVAAALGHNLVSDPVCRIAEVNGRVVRLDFVHFNQTNIEGG
jgi:hypothetical protein